MRLSLPFACALALASAPFLTGCSTAETDAGAAQDSAALQQPLGTHQSFPRLSWIVQRDFIDAFIAANGPEWGENPTIDPYMGFVRHAEAKVTTDPAVTITLDEAKAKGLAFIRDNAVHLGASEAEVAQLEFFTTTDSHDLFDRTAHFYLGYGATIPRPGYEAFPEVGTHVVIWLAMEADGHVSGIDQRYTERLPRITLGTVPPLAPGDDRVMANVAGRAFVTWNVFAGMCIGPAVNLGGIAPGDIATPALTMVVLRGLSLDVRLAYRLTVSKTPSASGRPRNLEYAVDAESGLILREPQKPCRDESN
jgi:hypothetical protein